jgi:TetR/AcrR family transcriptional repressor of mexAB-oprM operon
MRRTKEDAEKTRTAILAAAETLFLQNGVAHTSLEQIARAASVTRGAVYWHFQNKADLFHAMLSQVRLPQEQLIERLRQCDQYCPLQPLRNLCLESLHGIAANEQKRRIFTILLHRCEFTEELRPAQERHEEAIQQFLLLSEQQFAKAQQRGQLRPGVTPYLAAHALHGLILGIFSDATRATPPLDLAQDATAIIDALFRGLVLDWNPPPHTPGLVDDSRA